jgi:hypothetical protein
MAKRHTAFEHADAAYAAGQQVMAGHALKHLAAASACYAILPLCPTWTHRYLPVRD